MDPVAAFVNWIAVALGTGVGLGVLWYVFLAISGKKNRHAIALAAFFKKDNNIRLRELIHFNRFLQTDTRVMVSADHYVLVISVQGADLASLQDREVKKIFETRKKMLQDLDIKGLQVRQISTRNEVDFTGHMSAADGENPFPSKYTQLLFLKWMEKFQRSYRNSHYFVLSIPVSQKEAKKSLQEAMRIVCDGMSAYKPRVLKLDDDRVAKAGPLYFWSRLLNPGMKVEPSLELGVENSVDGSRNDLTSRLADQLIYTRVLAQGKARSGSDLIDFRQKDGYLVFTRGEKTTWMAAISLSKWSSSVSASLWSELLTAQHEMWLVQWWVVHDQETSLQLVGKKRSEEIRATTSASYISPQIGEEYDRLQAQLAAKGSEAERLVSYQATVFVTAPSRDELIASIESLEGLARQMRAGSFHREDRALRSLWLSIFPPNMEWIRQTDIKTANVASLTSLNDSPTGDMRNDWGDRPLTVFPTAMGSPYALNLHKNAKERSIGHTLMLLESDGGKTTLSAFLMAMASGYKNHYTAALDRHDGLYVPIKAFGGSYQHIFTDIEVDDRNIDLAPLQMDGATKVQAGHPDAKFLIGWMLENLCGLNAHDDESRRMLEVALQSLDGMQRHERSITQLATMIDRESKLGRALARWADPTRPDSNIFNGRRDTLDFAGPRITAFDMSLVDERMMTAFFPYLMHRLLSEMKRQDRPFMMIADEIAANMKYNTFSQYIARSLEEWRKNRGVLVMNFQHTGQIVDIPDAKAREAIISQTPTKIVGPNESWNKDHFINVLKFTESEFEHLSGQSDLAKRLVGQRWVMVKKVGLGSVIVMVDLSDLGALFKPLASSGAGPAVEYRMLEAAYGPAAALTHFINS